MRLPLSCALVAVPLLGGGCAPGQAHVVAPPPSSAAAAPARPVAPLNAAKPLGTATPPAVASSAPKAYRCDRAHPDRSRERRHHRARRRVGRLRKWHYLFECRRLVRRERHAVAGALRHEPSVVFRRPRFLRVLRVDAVDSLGRRGQPALLPPRPPATAMPPMTTRCRISLETLTIGRLERPRVRRPNRATPWPALVQLRVVQALRGSHRNLA